MNLLPGHMVYQADKVQVPRLRIHTLLILLCVAVTTDRSRLVNVELQPEGDDEPCDTPSPPRAGIITSLSLPSVYVREWYSKAWYTPL